MRLIPQFARSCTRSLNLVCALRAPHEVSKIEVDLVPPFVQTHRHRTFWRGWFSGNWKCESGGEDLCRPGPCLRIWSASSSSWSSYRERRVWCLACWAHQSGKWCKLWCPWSPRRCSGCPHRSTTCMCPFRTFLSLIWRGLLPMEYEIDNDLDW